MSKKLLIALAILALGSQALADVGNTNPADLVGVFSYNEDIGNPQGYGFTMDMGVGITPGLGNSREYLLTGGGGDVWGTSDQMHMAYNLAEGNVFIGADFDWVVRDNEWAKYGVMLRDSSNGTSYGGAANIAMLTRRDENLIQYQGRDTTDASSWGGSIETDASNVSLGIQRVVSGGFTVVQGLVDYGSGWEVFNQTVNPVSLGGEVMAGAFVTSHNNNQLAQVKVYNVTYETEDVQLIGVPTVDTNPTDQCSDVPGFKIRVMKRDMANEDWGYNGASDLLNGVTSFGILDDDLFSLHQTTPLPGWNPVSVSRIDPVVNLTQDDTEPAGEFDNSLHFPGIDLVPALGVFPDDSDDDDDFATEAIACIYLTEGFHIIGANSDDGTIIEIGGMEVGRTEEWKGSSNVDFLFEVAAEGFYSFRAMHVEGGGGASLELHEVLADGTRILLGATDETGAFLGSPVYAPEPATIALLGLGGLSLLRRKRS